MTVYSRVDVTADAAALLRDLVSENGPLMFHQSGGCCDGSSPMCFLNGEFITSDADVLLGDIIIGASSPTVPVWMSLRQFEYWKHTHLTIDVVPGRGAGFSLEAPRGVRFLIRSRLLTNAELTAFGLLDTPTPDAQAKTHEEYRMTTQLPTLEQHLDDLLEIERFEPPTEFVRNARVVDAGLHDQAKDAPSWWAEQARTRLSWDVPFRTELDDSNPPFFTWFADGKLNASYNCLDRHVIAGRGDKIAFHWHGDSGEQRSLTYADLLAEVQRLANVLLSRGVGKGDVVGIYLPMIPEVVVAMLACARIGAPHTVVFGGFAASSVGERLKVSNAKALITVDGSRRKGKTSPIKQAVDEHLVELRDLHTVVVVRATGSPSPMQEGRDLWYHESLAAADPVCPAAPMEAEHPLFLLYSSGSTAKPKGILHTTGGYLTGVATTMDLVFDLDVDKDIFWCTADVGWVTGHSYIVYGPMANGVTSVMFEGAPDYPDRDVWWDLIERYGVTCFYTAPTAIRACMKWGAEYPAKHDLSSLRLLGSVGEPINPKAWLWYHTVVGGERCPVVDTWWQTETGAIMIAPLPAMTATKPGSATRAIPGITAKVYDNNGDEVVEGTGVLVITEPWPAMLRTLYGDDDRYIETYFSRFGPRTYVVGDSARRDKDGYIWIIGRTDDVINVSGHRLSTAEVESALVSHPAVAEAAVVGAHDELTGQAIVAFVSLRAGVDETGLDAELREHVAERIGKLARPKEIIFAGDLPKTRSGKILRRLLRDVTDGREPGDVTTLADSTVLADLQHRAAGE